MFLNESPRNNIRRSINLKTNITILKIYQNSTKKMFPKKIKTITQSNSISINGEEKKNKEKNNLTNKKSNNINNRIQTWNFSNKKNIRYKSMNNKSNKNFDKLIKENISFINKYKNNMKQIVYIQRWWRTISSIILIQKMFRGFLFRFKNMYKFKIKVNKNSKIRKRNIPSLIHRINLGKKLLNSSIEDNNKIRHSFSRDYNSKTNLKRLNSYSGINLLLDDINSIKKVNTNNFIITSQYNFSVIDKEIKLKNSNKNNNNKSKIKKSHSEKKSK